MELSAEIKAAMSRFEALMVETPCPFARTARVMVSEPWRADLSVGENVAKNIVYLNRFLERRIIEGLDMFVIEVRNHDSVTSLSATSDLLYEVLSTLAIHDKYRQTEFSEGIEDSGWDFVYGNTRFFVPVFAPYYPIKHPRKSPAAGSVYIILQVDECFTSRGISSKSSTRTHLTSEVERHFLDRAYHYSRASVTHPWKAARYIKPLDLDDDPVYWWRRARHA